MGLRTRSTRIGLAAVAAGALVAAAPAMGANVSLSGGNTALQLDRGTAKVLTGAGISVAPIGSAAASGGQITFPVTRGVIDPSNAAGSIAHSGGLAFSARGTTVRATNFIIRTDTRRPVLTARVGAARVPLLNLDLSKAAVLRRGPGNVETWAVRVNTTLHPTAARALSAAFHTKIPAGVRIGRADVRTKPAQLALRGGATTLNLDPGTAAALTSLGVAPSVISPGTASASGLEFPVTGGRIAVGTFVGQIPHSGGIALTAGSTRVELKNFVIIVSGNPRLSAQVGDSSTRVSLNLDLSGIRAGVSNRTAVVRDAKVSLSAEAAAALNAAFGVTALTEGLPLGVADVRARVL
jgi:hypothetical protein